MLLSPGKEKYLNAINAELIVEDPTLNEDIAEPFVLISTIFH
jgi:hypothetical protein